MAPLVSVSAVRAAIRAAAGHPDVARHAHLADSGGLLDQPITKKLCITVVALCVVNNCAPAAVSADPEVWALRGRSICAPVCRSGVLNGKGVALSVRILFARRQRIRRVRRVLTRRAIGKIVLLSTANSTGDGDTGNLLGDLGASPKRPPQGQAVILEVVGRRAVRTHETVVLGDLNLGGAVVPPVAKLATLSTAFPCGTRTIPVTRVQAKLAVRVGAVG